jgi:hypothetical protein
MSESGIVIGLGIVTFFAAILGVVVWWNEREPRKHREKGEKF